MKIFHFIKQEIRTPSIQLMSLGLFLGVILISLLHVLSYRINNQILHEQSSFIGADLILTSSYPVNPKMLAQVSAEPNLLQTQLMYFTSMAEVGSQFKLVSVKAVNASYPLKGYFLIKNSLEGIPKITHTIPVSGEIWIDPGLLGELNISMGSSLKIGEESFKITGLIQNEPDALTDLLNIAPRILMNQNDVAKTKIIVPGSQVSEQYLWAGNQGSIEKINNLLKTKLLPGQTLISSGNSRSELKAFWERYQKYLRLSSVLTLFLCGMTIFLACRHFMNQQTKNIALYKCLGANFINILRLYFLGLMGICTVVILLGNIGGYSLEFLLEFLFRSWIQFNIPYSFHLKPVLSSAFMGYLFVLGFVLPALFSIKNISALQVLRKENFKKIKHIPWDSLIALFMMPILVILLSRDIEFSILLIGYLFVAFLIIFISGYNFTILFKALKKFFPVELHYGISNFIRNPSYSALQILSLSMVILVGCLMIQVRENFIDYISLKITKSTPNYFALNIQPNDLNPIKSFLIKEKNNFNEIIISDFYPIVRGRLIEKSNLPILQALSKWAREDSSLRRDLNFSWSDHLPPGNKVVDGKYNPASSLPEVSVEKGLAQRFDFSLQDELTFQIAEQKLKAKITSIREVDWSSFRPNFYYLFSKNVLDQFPHTYLASFYIPEKYNFVLSNLIKTFPSVSLIEISKIILDVKKTFDELSVFMRCILILTYIAVALLYLAIVQLGFEQRKQEATLLRTLGIHRRKLATAIWIEFSIIGFLAGFLGYISATWMTWQLTEEIFLFPFSMDLPLLGSTLIFSVFFTGMIGYLSLNRLIKVDPLKTFGKMN